MTQRQYSDIRYIEHRCIKTSGDRSIARRKRPSNAGQTRPG